MKRQVFIASLIVQFENPVQPPQFGAPVLINNVTTVVNDEGMMVHQPQHTTQTAIASDIGEEMFQALKIKLDSIGLTLTRKAAE